MKPRTLVILAGAALVLASFFVPVSRASDDGGRTLEGFWTLAAGATLAVFGLGLGTDSARAARFAALFVLGTAAHLALTEPLWLQHLRIRPEELRRPLVALGALVATLQALVVAAAGWRDRARLAPILRAAATKGVVLAALVAWLVSGAHVTKVWAHRSEPMYLVFLAAQYLGVLGIAAIGVLNLLLVVTALPAEACARLAATGARTGFGGDDAAERPFDRRYPRLLAVFVFTFGCLMGYGVLDSIPHIQDEVAFLFQAQCYAQGRLDMPPPPEPAAFGFYLLTVEDGRWYGAMNPGWPIVLVPATWLGVPFLVNPLLSALTVLAVHALTRRLGGRSMAHLVTTLLSASPWFLCVSGSVMTQPLSQLLTVAAALFLVRAKLERAVWPALVGGLLVGLQFLVRPLDAVVVALFVGTGVVVARGPRLRFAAAAAAVLGGLATSIWFLPFNRYFTGRPLRFTISHYFDRLWYPGSDDLGFGPDIGNPTPYRWVNLDPEPGHGLTDVLLNANQNLYHLNVELFGFGIGSLALIVLLLGFGRLRALDRALGGFCLLVAAAYSTYWFSGGPDFGARYWYLVLYPLLWLSARGILAIRDRLHRAETPFPGARVAAALLLLLGTTLVVFLPWRLIAKYPDYRSSHDDVRTLSAKGRFGRALVLVEVKDEVEMGPALALNRLPIGSADGPIYARDLGPESVARLREAFPDRPLFRLRGRSVRGDPTTTIVEGPLPPQSTSPR